MILVDLITNIMLKQLSMFLNEVVNFLGKNQTKPNMLLALFVPSSDVSTLPIIIKPILNIESVYCHFLCVYYCSYFFIFL